MPTKRGDLETLKKGFRGELIRPDHAAYEAARRVWNGMIDRRPALIARCADADEVAAVMAYARENDLPIAIRGGGHNVAGSAVCDDGLVIDFSGMKSVSVDAGRKVARVQAGAVWGEFDRAVQGQGLIITGGLV